MGRTDDDARRVYVLQLLASMWRDVDVDMGAIDGAGALDAFLDDPACSMLQARLVDKAVQLTTSVVWDDTSNNAAPTRAVLLVKVLPTPLTAENLSTTVHVTSMTNSPVFSLFQSVHKIYTPLLLQGASGRLSQKLKDVLLELDAGLQTLVRDKGDDVSNNSTDNLFGIVTLQDEIAYWEATTSGRDRDRASKFSRSFDAIHSRYATLEALSFEEMGDLLDDTNNTLDDLWRADLEGNAQYPQARMVHIIGLVAQALHRSSLHISTLSYP